MGSSLRSDVVPYKIGGVWAGDIDRPGVIPEPLKTLVLNGTEGYEEKTYDLIAGWTWLADDIVMFGKKRMLYVSEIRKGDSVVCEINEDQYTEGMELSFVSNNRDALVLFCDDFGLDASRIEENVAAHQTL